MKWQIAEEFLEEFVAKVNRTMTPRAGKKFITHPPVNPDQSSPLRSRYPPASETGTPNHPHISPPTEYMMSPSTNPPPLLAVETTPERTTSQRQFMPMSSPAPFYRYSSISTPATTRNDRSSPPSSGAIDLAETLVEFSSPVKLREPFIRRLSTPEEESPRPVRSNGIKSLGDLQGVDLLRGFEKISSWREGSSPIKEQFEMKNEHAELNIPLVAENGEVNGNGNGCVVAGSSSPPEEKDSQMTDIKMEEGRE